MSEIKLTDSIRTNLRTIRKKNKVTGKEIIDELGKHPSFISHIENGVVKTIEIDDLRNIVSHILKIDGQELDEYIEQLTNPSLKQTPTEPTKQENSFVYYDEQNKAFTEEGFKKILDNINFRLNKVFEEDPKYGFQSIGELMDNLRFDIGFMLGLNRIPFYLLKNAEREVKKQLFKDMRSVAKKYIDEYGIKTGNESEE